MIRIERTNQAHLIRKVVTNEKLYTLAGHSRSKEYYYPDTLNNKYLLAYVDNELAGVGELRPFNGLLWDSHIYILPKFQRRYSVDIAKELIKYAKEKEHITKIFTTVPLECIHVLKFIEKLEFKVSGHFINGINYNGRLQNLIIFERDL